MVQTIDNNTNNTTPQYKCSYLICNRADSEGPHFCDRLCKPHFGFENVAMVVHAMVAIQITAMI